MAESRVLITRPNSSSPPPNCAICLGCCTNRSHSDSCVHQFCFKCLLEWSRIKAECPLCKKPFRTIIHNIKENDEHDEHVVEITPTEEIHIIENEEFLYLPLGGNPRHQFHFRTTFTADTRVEHAIQQMLMLHPLTNGGQLSIEGYGGRNMYHRRRRDNTSTSFRRSIYMRNLWVNAPPDITGRYRDVSPSFFRSSPAARTRLVPWLNRELNALLYENTRLVMQLVDTILDHLLRHHICSRTFRSLLSAYLDNKTDHFIHEFYNFMRSPFDMVGYDRHVIYSERPNSPVPFLDVSDNDSDVIIVGTSRPDEPVVIDLVNTDSDEPILVSQDPPPLPMPMPERMASEPERRSPILPLKLRLKAKALKLKHKRQSREKDRERKIRQNKKRRRHRSRSWSSSSSTRSSSSDSSIHSYKKHKRRRKHKKSSKKKYCDNRDASTSSTDLNIESSSSESEDNMPLATLSSRKRYRKHKRNGSTFINDCQASTSSFSVTKESSKREDDPVPRIESLDNINQDVPTCSKYSSNASLNVSHQGDSPSSDVNLPSCSKFTYSPYSYELANTNNASNSTNHLNGQTSDEEYPAEQVKSEVREVQTPEASSSGLNKGRVRNILIKKEESSNSWRSYTCNYASESSSDS